MIRNPLALRLDPERPTRDQIYEAARLGARGVVVDAIGDLAPQRLSETGRLEVRHILRTADPANPEYVVGLAGALYGIGATQARRGYDQEAVAAYTQAVPLLEKLVKDYPERRDIQSRLAGARIMRPAFIPSTAQTLLESARGA